MDGSIPRWLPNAVTLLRIVLLGVFIALMGGAPPPGGGLPPGFSGALALTALFAIGASDIVDGYLARAYGLSSRVGVILDATADKVVQLGLTTYFVFLDPRLPLWFLSLLVLRDVAVGLGVWVLVRFVRDPHLEHEIHGKASTVLVFALLVEVTLGGGSHAHTSLLALTTVVVSWSTARYAVGGWRALRRGRSPGLGSGPTSR